MSTSTLQVYWLKWIVSVFSNVRAKRPIEDIKLDSNLLTYSIAQGKVMQYRDNVEAIYIYFRESL